MEENSMKGIYLKCYTCGYIDSLVLSDEHSKIVADAIDSGKSRTEVKKLCYSLDQSQFSDLILEDDNIGLFYEICYPVEKTSDDLAKIS